MKMAHSLIREGFANLDQYYDVQRTITMFKQDTWFSFSQRGRFSWFVVTKVCKKLHFSLRK